MPPAPKKRADKNGNGPGHLGFEATLWATADKLRGNLDAAEYKYVVLGLILPAEQRATQRLADQYNADARLWKKLEPKRRARRKVLLKLSEKQLKDLDLLEFAQARPPQECTGQWIQQ
jgi:type I restriction-modification system DNA methylase subunit